jgi:hypothetical protein
VLIMGVGPRLFLYQALSPYVFNQPLNIRLLQIAIRPAHRDHVAAPQALSPTALSVQNRTVDQQKPL